MKVLLTCCSIGVDSFNIPIKYDYMEGGVEWMLNSETKLPDVFGTLFMNISSWNFYSILAEVCLELAKRQENDNKKQNDLIKGFDT